MVQIRVHTPRKGMTFRRAQYLVITMDGVEFVERLYMVERVPSHLTRVYQLLLRLIWMKGGVTTNLARRSGYNQEVLKLASARGYVTIANRPVKPSAATQNKIAEMIGEAPRWIYA